MAGPEQPMPTEPIAGKYQLEGLLGSGGMAKVYRAKNILLNRQVAVKVLLEDVAQDPQVVRRFLREARAATAVRHPNVVDVLDVIQDETGRLYIVQELLEGYDLSQHVARSGGRLKVQEALQWLIPICDAVAVAHSLNIVHRDLKPENVFLAKVGRDIVPKVLDFGVSKIHDPKELKLTTTNAVIGTPSYMSPEQIQDTQRVGPPSDVWGLGVVLYEVLTGHLPYRATGANALMVAVCRDDPVPISERDASIPARLAGIVHRCLQRDPGARYASAHELSNALREYAGLEVKSDTEWQSGVDKALALPLDGLPSAERRGPPTVPQAWHEEVAPTSPRSRELGTGPMLARESGTHPHLVGPLPESRVSHGSGKITTPETPKPVRPEVPPRAEVPRAPTPAPKPKATTPMSVHGADRFSPDLVGRASEVPLELEDIPELRRASAPRTAPGADLRQSLWLDNQRHSSRFSGADAANAGAAAVLFAVIVYAFLILMMGTRAWIGDTFGDMPHVPLIVLCIVLIVTGTYLSTRAFLPPRYPGLALSGLGLLGIAIFLATVALETLWPTAPYRAEIAAKIPSYAPLAASVVPLGLGTVAVQRAIRMMKLGGTGIVFWILVVCALSMAGIMQVIPDIAAAMQSE